MPYKARMIRHRGVRPRRAKFIPSPAHIQKITAAIQASWDNREEFRRIQTGETAIVAVMVTGAQVKVATACEALGKISAIIGEAREALSWMMDDDTNRGITFTDCMEALGCPSQSALEKLLAAIDRDVLALLLKRGLYFCPICGPRRTCNDD